MAVIHLFGPLSLFWRYWRISLADFIASQVAFWVTIFVSAEIGIGAAAGWSVAWSLIRSAFVKPDVRTNEDSTTLQRSTTIDGKGTENVGTSIPDNVAVVHFTDSVFFPNANRAKVTALENISLVYPSVQQQKQTATPASKRSWSVASQRRLERLRTQHLIVVKATALEAVVWDFSSVPWIDVTGIIALGELKDDIRRQLGNTVSIRVVGMTPKVRAKFYRAGWPLSHVDGARLENADIVFDSIEQAVWHRDGTSLEGVYTEKTA